MRQVIQIASSHSHRKQSSRPATATTMPSPQASSMGADQHRPRYRRTLVDAGVSRIPRVHSGRIERPHEQRSVAAHAPGHDQRLSERSATRIPSCWSRRRTTGIVIDRFIQLFSTWRACEQLSIVSKFLRNDLRSCEWSATQIPRRRNLRQLSFSEMQMLVDHVVDAVLHVISDRVVARLARCGTSAPSREKVERLCVTYLEELARDSDSAPDRDAIVLHCVVCQTDIARGERVVTLPCMHVFHEKCMLSYLRSSRAPVCPTDRTPVYWRDVRNLPVWRWGDSAALEEIESVVVEQDAESVGIP